MDLRLLVRKRLYSIYGYRWEEWEDREYTHPPVLQQRINGSWYDIEIEEEIIDERLGSAERTSPILNAKQAELFSEERNTVSTMPQYPSTYNELGTSTMSLAVPKMWT